jgi:membrane protein
MANYLKTVASSFTLDTYGKLKLHAQSLAFDTLLAVVPALAVCFWVFKLFGGLAPLQDKLQSMIVGQLASTPQTQEQLVQYLHTFIENTQKTHVDGVSVVLLIVSVLSLLDHIETAFNQIFVGKQTRSIWKKWLAYLGILIAGPILLAASFALTALLQTAFVADWTAKLGFITTWVLEIIPLCITWLSFTIMFWGIPTGKVSWRSAFAAALIAGSLWHLAKYAYALYVKHAVSWQNIYGSLASLPLFILWLYVSWLLVLFGAEICYQLEVTSKKLVFKIPTALRL